LLLFLSPVFYNIDILPTAFQTIIYLNPIALIVENCRAVVIFGDSPDLKPLLIYSAVSVLVAFAGFHFFQRARKGFADVL
jgi:lipopolysaccharide transport system permease protein